MGQLSEVYVGNKGDDNTFKMCYLCRLDHGLLMREDDPDSLCASRNSLSSEYVFNCAATFTGDGDGVKWRSWAPTSTHEPNT